MASFPKGRRPALIPSLEGLTPEEVQDILANRVGHAFVRPPDPPPEIPMGKWQVQTEHNGSHSIKNSTIQQHASNWEAAERLDNKADCQQKTSDRIRTATSSSEIKTPPSMEKTIEPDRPSRRGSTILQRGSKRKRSVYAQDEHQNHSDEMLGDTPHMSDVESSYVLGMGDDEAFRYPQGKPIFFEVSRQSSNVEMET